MFGVSLSRGRAAVFAALAAAWVGGAARTAHAQAAWPLVYEGRIFDERGRPAPIAVYNGRFTDTQRRYKVNVRECFALVTAVRLLGRQLLYMDWVLQTDHHNLRFMATSKDPIIQRWWFEICNARPICVQRHQRGK